MLTKEQILAKKELLLNYLGNHGAISSTQGIKEIDSVCEYLEIDRRDFETICTYLNDTGLIKFNRMAGTWETGGKVSTIWLTPNGFEQTQEEKPKWLKKSASEEIQRQASDIVNLIDSWIPKQRFKGEEAYVGALAEHLEGKGIKAPEQKGSSLTDILAAYGIGLEIKLHPNRTDYDRLAGQIIRQLEEFGIVIVLIIRPDKRDLLEEYQSKFDKRVTFIIK